MSVEQVTAWLVLGVTALTFAGLVWRQVVRPIKRLADDVSELKREVVRNGDPNEDSRTLRAIVREQGRNICEVKKQLRQAERRFRRIEHKVELSHQEDESP